MPGPEFWQTGYGRTYYEVTLPSQVKAINTLAAEMKRQNDIKESELVLAGKIPPHGSGDPG